MIKLRKRDIRDGIGRSANAGEHERIPDRKGSQGKETGSIYTEDPGKGVAQIFGNYPAVSGGEAPPENDAAGNSGYYRDKTVEYGTV